jgi:hypothetical protein
MESKLNIAELATLVISDRSTECDYVLVEKTTRMVVLSNPRHTSVGQESNSAELPLILVDDSTAAEEVDHAISHDPEKWVNIMPNQRHQTMVSAERTILQKQEDALTPVFHHKCTLETSHDSDEQIMTAVHRTLHQGSLQQEASGQTTLHSTNYGTHGASGAPPRLTHSNRDIADVGRVDAVKEMFIGQMLQGVGAWV